MKQENRISNDNIRRSFMVQSESIEGDFVQNEMLKDKMSGRSGM